MPPPVCNTPELFCTSMVIGRSMPGLTCQQFTRLSGDSDRVKVVTELGSGGPPVKAGGVLGTQPPSSTAAVNSMVTLSLVMNFPPWFVALLKRLLHRQAMRFRQTFRS